MPQLQQEGCQTRKNFPPTGLHVLTDGNQKKIMRIAERGCRRKAEVVLLIEYDHMRHPIK
jgi:hypothetical protein